MFYMFIYKKLISKYNLYVINDSQMAKTVFIKTGCIVILLMKV